jgi:glycosyltransferase involved in cell wall biosynthesis
MTDLRHRNLLICSYYMPQPDCDSYSRRLFHFVEFLRGAGCDVTCVAKNDRGVDAFSGLLTEMGAKVFVGHDEHVARLVQTEFFDWALLGFWNIAEPLVEPLRNVSPATKIVVDSGDIHFLRHARRILQEADGRLGLLGEEYAWDTVRELNVYAAADAVLAVSRKESDLVADLIGDRRRTFAVPDSEDLAASPFSFTRRRGMFFVGNFEHPPNAEALAYLCDEILPHVDPALLAEHPLYVAGSHMTDAIRELADGWPTVRMLGWVPSVVPYLERVRASLIPLLHGAGTKRKMIQTLSIGTPTVTTSVGIEGFPLADEREVLVADDPVLFAAGITRLLTDEPLWNDLARVGRETILAEQSHDVARRRLLEALAAIQAAAAPTARKTVRKRPRMSHRDYDEAIRHARDAIVHFTPPGATVAVVSRGDGAVVKLDGRTGWHFPLGDDGGYAGFHPATGSEAVNQLEAVRQRGAEFFAIPAPFAWWLGYYGDLRAHLETRYRVIDADGEHCVLVSLREPPAGPQSLATVAAASGAAAEPTADELAAAIAFEGLSDRHVVMRSPAGPPPALSVVIPTRDRAALLAESLASLARQTVDASAFEVVVVSDGSTDGTADVCRDLAGRLRLTLVESPPSGIAVAKNLGVDAAAAPLVLFFDDDDVADSGLVAAHLAAHRRYPLEHVAVLGYTDWHPRLPITEVMRFITDVGHYLFGYTPLRDGQLLDHTFFWGGRSSCKRSLLVRAGGFRPEFTFGSEDIEAGHRICRMLAGERHEAGGGPGRVGLTVVYCRDAVQHMIRPITYDEFCRRCERQGRSQRQFSRFYDDRRVDEWCGVHGAERRWRELRGELAIKVTRVHELEHELATAEPAERDRIVKELHGLYWWTFDAFKTKGIVEAAGHA